MYNSEQFDCYPGRGTRSGDAMKSSSGRVIADEKY